ncbi:AAEL011914-PA [Aedes aegypti]|uniref:AAEL011914-PA n=1 Tax=Aedes aegypti TaxID=7159 RepID=Q16NM1_AEDAE|nr:AAEL011914-PA [Aedes aegypti]
MSTDDEDRSDVETADYRDGEFRTPVCFVTDRKAKQKSRNKMDAKLKADFEAKEEEIQKLKMQLLQIGAGTSGGTSFSVDRRPDFRELKELVSKFNPKDPTCLSAEEWIKKIDTTAAHYKWKEDTKLHCARLNLEGSAKLWWAGVQSVATTWATFSQKLVNAYPSARDPIFYHNQMSQRKKQKEETLDEYVFTQVAMGKRAGFEESVIVKYVINGLRNFTANCKVTLAGKIATVEALMEQLKWMEGFMDAPSERDVLSEELDRSLNFCQ